jgi:hypothetical protein
MVIRNASHKNRLFIIPEGKRRIFAYLLTLVLVGLILAGLLVAASSHEMGPTTITETTVTSNKLMCYNVTISDTLGFGDTVLEEGSLSVVADYVVFTNGTTVYLRNGTTGAIDWSSANATALIQAGIDNMTDGGRIHLMAGAYSLDSSIVPKNGTWISGAGAYFKGDGTTPGGTALCLANGADCDLIDSEDTANRNIKITDLHLYGNMANQGSNTLAGIRIYAARFCTIQNVQIHEINGTGIIIGDVGGGGTGYWNKIANVHIHRCDSADASYGYGYYDDGPDENVLTNVVIVCKSGSDDSHGFLLGAGLDQLSNCWVVGGDVAYKLSDDDNMLSNCCSDVARDQALKILDTSQHNTISGFYAYFANYDAGTKTNAIQVDGDYNVMSDIHVYTTSNRCYYGIGFTATSSWNTLTNFYIEKAEVGLGLNGGYNTASQGAIYDTDYRCIEIKGEQCSVSHVTMDTRWQGITVDNGDDAKVEDCFIDSHGGDTGIHLNDGDDVVIQNNRIRGAGSPIDADRAAAVRPMIMGNNWEGCSANASIAAATTPRITCNIATNGDWWSTEDNPS